MPKPVLSLAIVAIAAGLLMPAAAPAQRDEKVLIIYGNDPCPTSKSGDEVVVCSRQPEADRYRIPQELRGSTMAPSAQPWSARAGGVIAAGGDRGPSPCTNVGGAGGSNCFQNQMRQARAEAAADKAQVAESPIPK